MRGVATRLQRAAQKAGFADWDSAIKWTADLPRAQAAQLLKVPGPSIYQARVRLGVQRPPTAFQAANPAHHGVFGYHRGCRCVRCRAAYGAHREGQRRQHIDNHDQPPHHGVSGYTGYGCRCEVCSKAWLQYKRQWAMRPKEGVVQHDTAGYDQGCRCLVCREAAGRPFKPRKRAPETPPAPVLRTVRPDRHGTQSGYRAGCRCDECRQAESTRQAAYHRAKKQRAS